MSRTTCLALALFSLPSLLSMAGGENAERIEIPRLGVYETVEAASPTQAILRQAIDPASGICNGTLDLRTTSIHVVNNTSVAIKLAFFQGKAEAGTQPENYAPDTGTYVGCKNLPPGADCVSDPCYSGGSGAPILADVCRGSIQVYYDGQTQSFTLPEQRVPQHRGFWRQCGWSIDWRHGSSPGESVPFEISPTTNIGSRPPQDAGG